MILTITLNPLLEIRLDYQGDIGKEVHRGGTLSYSAGGKGVNVSRQLKALGIDSLIFTTASGLNGKRFLENLEKDGLKSVVFKTLSETRISVLIGNESEQKNYFSLNQTLSGAEREEILSKLLKIIPTVDTIVISGSTPDEGSADIIAEILKQATTANKLTLLDYYGPGLGRLLDYSPVIVHNNFEEIRSSLGHSLDSEDAILQTITEIHGKGVRQVYLTNGADRFYASNNGYIYLVEPPAVKTVSTIGCGDAFVSGIIYSMIQYKKFEEGLEIATAFGALEATKKEVCRNTLSEIEPFITSVKVSPVGKKMNELNVPRAN
ncbi:MAG: 1-phosphofructokinase [Ignavibacteriaceae bacterium]|nr:1-phosphofructokinase [Ignavibacteriaceae bacterium]